MSDFKIVKLLDPAVILQISIEPRGEYDNATQYETGDLVSYQGASYIAKGSTLGNLPTDTAFWQILVNPPVDSVNGQTGTVVLDSDDIDDSSTTNKFITQSQLDQITTNQTDIAQEVLNRTNADANLQSQIDSITSSDFEDTFETVSKNLRQYPNTLNYTGNRLTSIIYDLGSSQTITKTLNYTGNKLISVVLSGDTPAGIDLTKTLTYTGDKLTSVAYT